MIIIKFTITFLRFSVLTVIMYYVLRCVCVACVCVCVARVLRVCVSLVLHVLVHVQVVSAALLDFVFG